jgi:NADH-quinone oxidoreductase subunit G
MAQRMTAAPTDWLQALASIAAAVALAQGLENPFGADVTEAARAAAQRLSTGERKAVLLGNAAAQHPQAADLLAVANWIGESTGASVGFLGEGANAVGAQWVGALPGPGGLDAAAMLEQPRKALFLLNVEPVLDMDNPQRAHAALQKAEMVVAFTAFRDAAVDGADVLLPIAPFSETAGTFVNAEGRPQSFQGVVKPRGDARPAWKVMRVLGNLLGLSGFDFESVDQVRLAALGASDDFSGRLSNITSVVPSVSLRQVGGVGSDLQMGELGLQRVAEVPIYATDSLVRRATALQATADARPVHVGLPPSVWQALALRAGDRVRVTQGATSVTLPARLEPGLAEGTARVPAGVSETAALGAMTGMLRVAAVGAAVTAAGEGVAA